MLEDVVVFVYECILNVASAIRPLKRPFPFAPLPSESDADVNVPVPSAKRLRRDTTPMGRRAALAAAAEASNRRRAKEKLLVNVRYRFCICNDTCLRRQCRERELEERMKETRIDFLNACHLRQLPKLEDYLRHYEAVAPIKQPVIRTVTDEAYQAYKKRLEEQEKKNAALDAMDVDLVPTGTWDGLTAEDRKKTSEWDRALSKAQHEVSHHMAKSLTETPTTQLPSIAETESNEPPILDAKLMYQISSRREPPAELPIDSPFMEIDVSAETLRTVSKYLDDKTIETIKADSDHDMETATDIGEISKTSGVPAFRREMITEEDMRVYEGITDTNSNGINVSVDNCDFTLRDIHTLKPGKWINDNVVNGYMKLLQNRESEKEGGPSCHFHKTFLTTNIHPTYQYNLVRKWTSARRLKNWGQSKATILDCDYVFFPVHLHASHWVLVVADLTKKTLRYYDSLGANASKTVQL